jgi:hypothetical protein
MSDSNSLCNDLKKWLLQASDNQLDFRMIPMIEKWDDDPKAIQILEVLDKCIYASLASEIVISVLQIMLDEQIRKEKTTMDELVKLATWRVEVEQ